MKGPAPAPPATLVIFGATGDLTRRLLVPALTNLCTDGLICPDFRIIGIGTREGGVTELRDSLDEFAPKTECWASLRSRIEYLRGDFTQQELFARLKQRLGDGNVAFYLAVAPRFFASITQALGASGLLDEAEGRYRRVAIEKPFGHDLHSAQELNQQLLDAAREQQLYRIDHYLGKETVQNIMVFRFANALTEAGWNANHIDHVQITAAETVDVGTRGSFYDATGAARDMVPNHLFQLLAMIGMEPPNDFGAEQVRTEKAKLLRAIRRATPEEARAAVRGRYRAGRIGDRDVPAYRETQDVAADSRTETFVALKLHVDTWRWAGVPFYLRTGKALGARDTEIVIQFKPVPYALFRDSPVDDLAPNRLVIQVQPDEGIRFDFLVKRPGPEIATAPAILDFAYADRFDIKGRTGYETLLYDLLTGDQTLFQRADQIEAGWAALQPFLDAFADGLPEDYDPGSAGPAAADAMIARDGRRWHPLG